MINQLYTKDNKMKTGNIYVVYDAFLYNEYLITKIVLKTDNIFKVRKLCRKYKHYDFSTYPAGTYQDN